MVVFLKIQSFLFELIYLISNPPTSTIVVYWQTAVAHRCRFLILHALWVDLSALAVFSVMGGACKVQIGRELGSSAANRA